MIYKFQSKATGELIMLGPDGDELLKVIGKAPAPRGIIEPDDMPAAVSSIEAALARAASGTGQADKADSTSVAEPKISLRQRAWPFVEMLRRAHAEGAPITWGV